MKIIKIVVSLVLLTIPFLVFTFPMEFDYGKDHGRLQSQLTERIKSTLGIWAVIKGASVVISTLQTFQTEVGASLALHATFSINPLGGLVVVGKILDQVSNILLWATGTLSAQKILLAVSVWVSLRIIVPICILLIVAAIWSKQYSGRLKKILAGIVVITLAICFAVPLSLEMSNLVEKSILAGQIHRTTNEINSLAAHIEKEGGELNDSSGFLNSVRQGTRNVGLFFQGIKQYTDRLIENIIDYIMIFLIVNILIPVATLVGLKILIGVILKYIGFKIEGLKMLERKV
jgi:hypothetical protein